MCIEILKQFIHADIFNEHCQGQLDIGHKVKLLKAVVENYIDIRLHYAGKLQTAETKDKSKRQLYNKLKLFQAQSQPDELCDELLKDIADLEELLAKKQAELAEEERIALEPEPRQLTSQKPKEDRYEREKCELVEACLRQKLVLGTEVVAYEKDQLCCVTYTMQHNARKPVQHGLRIDMDSGTPMITKYALPVGFNLDLVISDYDNVMRPECLNAVWVALAAYYNREQQYLSLTEVIKRTRSEAKTFALSDHSHVELRLQLCRAGCEGTVSAELDLDYGPADTRAHNFNVRAEIQEEDMNELIDQCFVFKKKPMDEAFSKCFLEDRAPWQCIAVVYEVVEAATPEQSVESSRRRDRRMEPLDSDTDDEWLPEDISPR